MRILVGTPTANGLMTTEYVESLFGVIATLGGAHQFDWRPIQGTIISMARNAYASLTLEGGYDALLFVDSDMAFRPVAVERMLALEKPLTACAYPARNLDIAAFHAAARRIDDPREAFAAALSYHLAAADPKLAVEGGAARVDGAATGLMLIRREVFEALAKAQPDLVRDAAGTEYAPHGIKQVLQCFEPVPGRNGVAMGEDLSFCRRWRDLGGEIWAIVDEFVGHVGPFTFVGRPSSKR